MIRTWQECHLVPPAKPNLQFVGVLDLKSIKYSHRSQDVIGYGMLPGIVGFNFLDGLPYEIIF